VVEHSYFRCWDLCLWFFLAGRLWGRPGSSCRPSRWRRCVTGGSRDSNQLSMGSWGGSRFEAARLPADNLVGVSGCMIVEEERSWTRTRCEELHQ
jgi:hypothetical protein